VSVGSWWMGRRSPGDVGYHPVWSGRYLVGVLSLSLAVGGVGEGGSVLVSGSSPSVVGVAGRGDGGGLRSSLSAYFGGGSLASLAVGDGGGEA
jgi:hypothetical protein